MYILYYTKQILSRYAILRLVTHQKGPTSTLLIIILFVLLAGFVIYQLLAFKTFSGPGFSFRYPSNWVVNNYQNGEDAIFVLDENHREIITMQTNEMSSNDYCNPDPNKKVALPLGKNDVNVDLPYACIPPIIQVKTSNGKLFYFSFRYLGIGQTDKNQAGRFLKTIKGLEFIRQFFHHQP